MGGQAPAAPSRAGARGGRGLLLALVGALSACTAPTEPERLARAGTVTGRVSAPVVGDAWVFLYRPGEGPPGAPAEPQAVTAIGARRLATDPRYVLPDILPNPWRLFGLLDVDGDFDGAVDVLSQPTAGDRVSAPLDFQAQPGRGAEVDLAIATPVVTEPPAFSLEGEADDDVLLDPAVEALRVLTLVADPVGRFDPARVGFTFGLRDADGDQRPDDADGDGTPDLSLQLFLRWRPRPGQLPSDTTVVVPLAFDPSPFLRTLEGRLDTTVTAARLQVAMLPQATSVGPGADGGVETRAFGTPPPGDYELVALAAGGQFWRLPNGLAAPHQQARFHVDRDAR